MIHNSMLNINKICFYPYDRHIKSMQISMYLCARPSIKETVNLAIQTADLMTALADSKTEPQGAATS